MYQILLLPLLSGIITQAIKIIIQTNKANLSWKSLFAYSGMPSGHSAIIVSLTTIVGLVEGLHSPIFAVCVVLSIIIIRDALGFRRYLGQHGKVLNILVKDLRDDQVLEEKYPKLLERIGHTPAQVLVGSIIGFLISLVGYYII